MHSERERIRGRESPNFVIEGVRNVCDCPEPVGVTHLRGASTVRGGNVGWRVKQRGVDGRRERRKRRKRSCGGMQIEERGSRDGFCSGREWFEVGRRDQ